MERGGNSHVASFISFLPGVWNHRWWFTGSKWNGGLPSPALRGGRGTSAGRLMVLESPSSFQHGGMNIKCFYSLQNLLGALCTYQQEWEGFFFFFIKNLFLEMFIIKHPVLELLKTRLSKESPNLVNNFKASHDFLQIWVCWKHSKNFISSAAAWCNCVISHPSDAAGEISFCTGQEHDAVLVVF